MYEDYDSHPIVDLVNYGFNVYLNTDNRLMSNTSVSNELEIAKGLGIENVEKLLLYSASDSFFDQIFIVFCKKVVKLFFIN